MSTATISRRIILGVLLAGLLVGLVLAGSGGTRTALPYWPAPPAAAVALQTREAHLQILPDEGTKLHIHSHLNITLNGQPIIVPANVGIDTQRKLYSEIHTHDTSGILHVESARGGNFYLDQFLTEWGLSSDAHRLSDFDANHDGIQLTVYVNQRPRATGLQHLQLRNHEDISIAITSDGSQPRPAKAFTWPKGY